MIDMFAMGVGAGSYPAERPILVRWEFPGAGVYRYSDKHKRTNHKFK